MKRRLILWSAPVVALVGYGALGTWGDVQMQDQIGVRTASVQAIGECRDAREWPLRYCRTKPEGVPPRLYREGIVFNRFTRHVHSVTRSWRFPDSTSWRMVQDSLTDRMHDLGGDQFTCDWSNWPDGRGHAAWRFAQHDVQLHEFSWPTENHGVWERAAEWGIELTSRSEHRGCPRPRRIVRLMTPREIRAAVQRRLAELWNGSG